MGYILYRDLYQTEILGVHYGNSLLSVDGPGKAGKVIFDTGSSYTYFTKEAHLNLVASVSSYVHSLQHLE